jgi:hypothetical protein
MNKSDKEREQAQGIRQQLGAMMRPLLSELGGYLLSPAQAPAGTKRLSNLLRSRRWSAEMIDEFLWEQADEQVQHLTQAGERVLALWDESVVEKAESLASEGLCPVRSSQAA